ncbi:MULTISPECIES: BamA/TamA family outer membrane protein [unclassified Arcicella]|uniref:BamA/TamA family outer membrane protein n=1 Tax=unclassified Arcicella TaxID=2644986 RepID=UPI00285E7586|nr:MULTISPECIES: BamA/TamA family outer membrane protein [unclassified Arcicella]MDR6563239.1 hypothetical protein [Arcicella sp. BE51]MDR6811610.1 hypothetical protein [Arcicella sp. BE140]MDR6823136.1 hypothetical protein [Arcicella sp. BE139]
MKKQLLCYFFLFSFFQSKAAETDSTSVNKLANLKIVKFFTGHKYLVSPFVFYMPETSWVLGGGVKRFFNGGGEGDSLTRVSNTAVFLQYSLNSQIMFEHNYQIFTNKEKYYIVGYYGFSRFPVLFYGVGAEAKPENEEAITFDLIRFDNLTYRKIANHTFAGLGWRYFKMYNVQGKSNGILENGNDVVGREGSTVSGLNVSVQFDNRDNVLTTSQGSFLQIEYSAHEHWTGSTQSFHRWQLDARKFLRPFAQRKDVLAFQTFAFLTNGNVPFHELGLLGGDMIMRGYYVGSRRDKDLLAFQTEYRWQALKRWGLVGFGGLGWVNNKIGDMNMTNILPSYGAGLRFKINRKENVNVRVDYGFGNGQQNLYFFIAEAF